MSMRRHTSTHPRRSLTFLISCFKIDAPPPTSTEARLLGYDGGPENVREEFYSSFTSVVPVALELLNIGVRTQQGDSPLEEVIAHP